MLLFTSTSCFLQRSGPSDKGVRTCASTKYNRPQPSFSTSTVPAFQIEPHLRVSTLPSFLAIIGAIFKFLISEIEKVHFEMLYHNLLKFNHLQSSRDKLKTLSLFKSGPQSVLMEFYIILLYYAPVTLRYGR